MKETIHALSTPVACLLFCAGVCGPAFAHANEEGEIVAYWRFEEGVAGDLVEHPQIDVVLDSSTNGQHLRTWAERTAPTYVADVPSGEVPQTSTQNDLALRFTQHQDVYSEGKAINSMLFEEWTIEASFKADVIDRWQVIVGKDGNPVGGAPPVSLKMRPDGFLDLSLVDGAGETRVVGSVEPLQAGEWYNVAGVATDTVLSLWIKSSEESVYVLQNTVSIQGAFFDYPDLNRIWTIGRGMWNGGLADYFDGWIDEVRISGRALRPWDFLGSEADAVPAQGTLIELSAATLNAETVVTPDA